MDSESVVQNLMQSSDSTIIVCYSHLSVFQPICDFKVENLSEDFEFIFHYGNANWFKELAHEKRRQVIENWMRFTGFEATNPYISISYNRRSFQHTVQSQ